jgi:hypothetical protein
LPFPAVRIDPADFNRRQCIGAWLCENLRHLGNAAAAGEAITVGRHVGANRIARIGTDTLWRLECRRRDHHRLRIGREGLKDGQPRVTKKGSVSVLPSPALAHQRPFEATFGHHAIVR